MPWSRRFPALALAALFSALFPACTSSGYTGATLVRQTADEVRPSEGEAVRLHADPAGIHLFDAATGVRLEAGA